MSPWLLFCLVFAVSPTCFRVVTSFPTRSAGTAGTGNWELGTAGTAGITGTAGTAGTAGIAGFLLLELLLTVFVLRVNNRPENWLGLF